MSSNNEPNTTTLIRPRSLAAIVMAVAVLATLLTPVVGGTPTVWASATSDRYEVVLQDDEYLYVLDNDANTKTWASHCADELGTARAVTWDDLKDVSETETPSCDVLVDQVGSGATAAADAPAEAAPVAPVVGATAPEATDPAGNGHPNCDGYTSDPDGDGYGWENNATCLVPAPAAPASVSTASIKGGVLIEWTPSEYAQGYNVYRDGEYLDTVVGDTEYRDLVAQGTYEYSITSFGPGGLAHSPGQDAPEPGRSLPSAVLSLGDSFISGEGGRWIGETPGIEVPNAYESGTNRFGVGANLCHRSNAAPIHSLGAPGVEAINIACSGAVGNDVLTDGQWGETPQIDQLRIHANAKHLDVVAISIGGNDMGFGEMVEKCVKDYANFFRSECQSHRQARYEGNIESKMTPAVEAVVAEVKSVMAEAGQPEARIVLLSYPSTLAETPRWRDATSKISHGCPFHTNDMGWINNGLVPKIDQTYAEIASTAGIEFLSLSNAFDGKQNCSEGVTSSRNTQSIDRLEWTVGTSIRDNERIPESMHPNALGQVAIGRCLELMQETTDSLTHKCFNNGGSPQDMRLG